MKIWGETPKVTGVYDKQKKINRVDSLSAVSSKKDVLSISNQAKDFQSVMKALKETPDIRQDKIREISDKYEAGTYDVGGKDIADKIVRSMLDKRV